MSRALSAAIHWLWWRFVLLTADPRHPAYIHAQWRMYQEMQTLRGFIRGEE